MPRQKNHIDTNKIAKGDESEWDKLFEQYYQILVKHADSIINDIHLANDIVDIVFAKLWRQRSTVANIKSFGAYLTRTVKNEALTYIQKLTKKRKLHYLSDMDVLTQTTKSDDPEVCILQKELQKLIAASIEKLTPKQREVINLILMNTDISTRELGRTMGCSHKNVQVIIGRIRVRFQSVYKLLKE